MDHPWKPTPWKPKHLRMKKSSKKDSLHKIMGAAICLALAMILPFFIGQIPEIGQALSPMHIPILLCGFLCGWRYGLIVGFIAPVMRSVLFGMPPLVPVAMTMSFELAAYGFLAGFLWYYLKKYPWGIYGSLVIAMFLGRIVWGIAAYGIFFFLGKTFTMPMFLAGAFINAVPGIILHIVLIPPIVFALRKANLLPES